MYTLSTLTLTSLKMYMRNRQALFFTLFIPVVIMGIFGALNFDQVSKTPIGIVTGNPTAATQALIDQLKKFDLLDIKAGTEEEERLAIKNGDRAAVLIIPDDFMPDPSSKKVPEKKTLAVLTNPGQAGQVQIILSALNQMLDKTTLGVVRAPELFAVKTEEINANNLRYIDFLLPGILAMSVMQMAVFSVAFVFADYKEKGILKRLIATPMRPYQFVSANVAVRLLITLIQVAVLIGMGIGLFHAQVIGAWWLLILVSILGCLMFLALGFIVSGLSKTVEAVPALANLFVFPMLFLSGIFFPMDAMPDWLSNITQYLPLTYFADALREVMVNGSGFSVIASDVYWMIGWSVALIVIVNYVFSFEEKRA